MTNLNEELTSDKQTIVLFVMNGVWMSQWSDKAIIDLFGSDILPTAFKQETPSEVVLEKIREFNPSYNVIMATNER
jgi:hypothetical protein